MFKAQADIAILLVLVRLELILGLDLPLFIPNGAVAMAAAVAGVRSSQTDPQVNFPTGPVPVQGQWELPADLLALFHVQLRIVVSEQCSVGQSSYLWRTIGRCFSLVQRSSS